jgi:hypothetical protein
MGFFDDLSRNLGYAQAPSANGVEIPKDKFTQAPNAQENRTRLAGMLDSSQQRVAPTSAGTGINRSDLDFRQGQTDLVGNLQQAAAGNGPSVAGQLMREGTDRAIAQNTGMLASNPSLNPALAARMAAEGAQQQTTASNAEAAKIKVAEQIQARQELSQLLGGARTQDIGLNTSAAQMGQQNQQFNVSSALEQQKINDMASQYYNSGMMTLDEANRKAQQDYYTTLADQNLQIQALNQKGFEEGQARRSGGIAGVAGMAAGALALMSDETQKEDIKPADQALDKFLDSMLIKRRMGRK